jgi:hypothetical protein
VNVLTCDHCEETENQNNEMDWLTASDQYGWNGDFCGWECLRDFSQEMVDNPPETIDQVPALQPDPEPKPTPKK